MGVEFGGKAQNVWRSSNTFENNWNLQKILNLLLQNFSVLIISIFDVKKCILCINKTLDIYMYKLRNTYKRIQKLVIF